MQLIQTGARQRRMKAILYEELEKHFTEPKTKHCLRENPRISRKLKKRIKDYWGIFYKVKSHKLKGKANSMHLLGYRQKVNPDYCRFLTKQICKGVDYDKIKREAFLK